MAEIKTVFKRSWVRELLIFAFLLAVTFINEREDFSNDHGWIDGMFIFLLLYVHMQINRFFLLPDLYKGKYVYYLVSSILLIGVFTLVAVTCDFYLTNVGWFDEIGHSRLYLIKFYLFSFSTTIPLLVAVHSIYLNYLGMLQREKEKSLLKEMELNLLKRQLDPHFLFNALNGLYGLSLEQPNEIPAKILQISDIMRYHVQYTSAEWISLQTEVSFLKQFIAFETDRQQMYIQVNEDIRLEQGTSDLRIAPVILISFVENAFKHVRRSAKGCYVSVTLRLTAAQELSLIVENSAVGEKTKVQSLQTGLANVRRRLDLLYKDRYQLSMDHRDDSFHVALLLALTNPQQGT